MQRARSTWRTDFYLESFHWDNLYYGCSRTPSNQNHTDYIQKSLDNRESQENHPNTPKGRLDDVQKGVKHEKTQENLNNSQIPKDNINPYTGEIGGPAGPEPTRYGDWERRGRVTDF